MSRKNIKNESIEKNISVFAIVGFSLLFWYQNGFTGELQKEFSLTSELTYQTNPTYASQNEKSVGILRIEPSSKFTYQHDVDKIYFNALLSVYRNSNEDAFANRENPNLALGWERMLNNGLIGVLARYTQNIALNELIDVNGQSTGNIVDNQSETKVLQAYLNYSFNELFSIENQLSYQDVAYSESLGGLVDFSFVDGTSKFIYELSPTLRSYAVLGYQNFKREDQSSTNIARVRLGAMYLPFEGVDVDANIGYYKASGDESDSGLLAMAVANYTRDRVVYSLGLNKDLVATGVNGLRNVDTISLGVNYLISEVQTFGAEYQHRKTENLITDVKRNSVGIFYSHQFESWVARVDAKHSQVDNGAAKNNNNLIGVSLVYGPLSF